MTDASVFEEEIKMLLAAKADAEAVDLNRADKKAVD